MAMRRALVVDDDAAIRVLVSRLLSRQGFAVDAVRDGAEAIEMLLQHAYDVIALDLMMPRIDGFGVVKYLGEHRPELLEKVIVLTAFGTQALTKVCPPVARFVEKPFDVERLLAEAAGCVGAEESDVTPVTVDAASGADVDRGIPNPLPALPTADRTPPPRTRSRFACSSSTWPCATSTGWPRATI